VSDLEHGRPGKVGKSYPAVNASDNRAPTAQASIVGDKFGLFALVVAIVALVCAAVLLVSVWQIGASVESALGAIQNSAASSSQAAVDAALAAERADKAERSAALSREYAVQVYPQLNRLGYPVLTPGEEGHPAALPEDYERLDRFAETRR